MVVDPQMLTWYVCFVLFVYSWFFMQFVHMFVVCDVCTDSSEAPCRSGNVGPTIHIFWKAVCRTVSLALCDAFLLPARIFPQKIQT